MQQRKTNILCEEKGMPNHSHIILVTPRLNHVNSMEKKIQDFKSHVWIIEHYMIKNENRKPLLQNCDLVEDVYVIYATSCPRMHILCIVNFL